MKQMNLLIPRICAQKTVVQQRKRKIGPRLIKRFSKRNLIKKENTMQKDDVLLIPMRKVKNLVAIVMKVNLNQKLTIVM